MNRAMLALLLMLTGQTPGSPVSDVPSAAISERAVLTPAQLVGAWRGSGDMTASPAGLDVAFSPGIRPATVFGYFAFEDADGREGLKFRQLSRVLSNRVSFVLADGREIDLMLDADGRRLFGTMSEGGRESAVALSRLRQRE